MNSFKFEMHLTMDSLFMYSLFSLKHWQVVVCRSMFSISCSNLNLLWELTSHHALLSLPQSACLSLYHWPLTLLHVTNCVLIFLSQSLSLLSLLLPGVNHNYYFHYNICSWSLAPLSPLTPTDRGGCRPHWVWVQRFLLVKREFLLSVVSATRCGIC